MGFGCKTGLHDGGWEYIMRALCGRSSVVERHVANVNVVSSNLIARFFRDLRGVYNGVFNSFCEVPANLLVRRWSL